MMDRLAEHPGDEPAGWIFPVCSVYWPKIDLPANWAYYLAAGPAAVRRMFSPPDEWTPTTESESAAAWAGAIDRLASDATAPLVS